MTIHSALLLGHGKYGGFRPLHHDKLNSLRSKLSKLALLIIDEVSMVGSNMLLEIHKRLQQIRADIILGDFNENLLAKSDLRLSTLMSKSWIFTVGP